MPAVSVITASLTVFRKPMEDLYGSATGIVKKKLKIMTTEAKIKEIHKAISAVQKVKTLWQSDKEVKLLAFYYPSKLIISRSAQKITFLSEVSDTERFVIQGTVGQGKSIFLRYLCITELAAGNRIPVFAELRRFDPKVSFRQFLFSYISLYQISCDDDVFDHLADSGKLVLLLDGFDEIEPDSVGQVLTDIEMLAQRYPKLQMVITSRPDSGIERSPHFRVYKLAALSHVDHKPFLERIVAEKSRVVEILTAIQKSSVEIKSLLQTPLLMTLLVIIYNATQEVPSSLSQFYDELFNTLLTRHDRAKPGYRRKRATHLSDSELKRLFEAFCYAARQQDQLVMSESMLVTLVERACDLTEISCSPDDFASDTTKVACLMQHEGFEYHFIHKSVVEFHAASFIRRSSEEIARRFYAAMHFQKWHKWQQELIFLSQIDRVRYLRYFYVPSAIEAMTLYEVELNDETMRRLLNRITVAVETDRPLPVPNTFQFGETSGFVTDEVDTNFLRAIMRELQENRGNLPEVRESIGLGDYLASAGRFDLAAKHVPDVISSARAALKRAEAELAHESRILDFLAP